MSRHHIVWSRGAEARLAKMWNDNPAIRSDISEACKLIESALARNPLTTGREQSEHSRVITRPPITVLYRVYPSNSLVRVIWVKFWDD
jgi:hypothetical protein